MALLVLISAALADPRAAWTTVGASSSTRRGTAVAGGDANNDGYADVVVAADGGNGVVAIWCGAPGGVDPTACTTFSGTSSGTLGGAIVLVGDMDGDGWPELAMADAAFSSSSAKSAEGYLRVARGGEFGVSTTSTLWTDQGGAAGVGLGTALAAADLDGDGLVDLIATAPGLGTVTAYDAGGAVVWRATGDVAGEFGATLVTGGDVDGDGYADFAVGAPGADTVYIYAGGAPPSSTPTWTVTGIGRFGAGLALGDLDGDGLADLVVGAPDDGGGSVTVFAGTASGPSAAVVTLTGADTDEFGAAVALGDFDGDGTDDLAVGAPGVGGGRGAIERWNGGSFGLSMLPDHTGTEPLDGLRLGAVLTALGDVDGDGFVDLGVGTPDADSGSTNSGSSQVWYGSAAGATPGDQAWAEAGTDDETLGSAVTFADLDGDGNDDVVVAAVGADTVYIWSGGTAGVSEAPAFTLSGDTDSQFGCAVAGLGDVDGDGYDELAVGASRYDNGQTDEGRVSVYSGDFRAIDTTPWGFESGQASANFGAAVAAAGDVDADGHADLLVGAPAYDDTATGEGAAFLFLGTASGLGGSVAALLEVGQAGAALGTAVDGGGDIDGDGLDDLVVGAPAYDDSKTSAGAVFAWFGAADALSSAADWTDSSGTTSGALGSAVTSHADLDGDGYADVAGGCPGCATHGVDAGEVWIWYGDAWGLATAPDDIRYGYTGDALGVGLTSADADQDGVADLVAGARGLDDAAPDGGGIEIWLASADTSYPNLVFAGPDEDVALGAALAVGDLDDDGSPDLLVGAPDFVWGADAIGRVWDFDLADEPASTVPRATSWYPDADGDGYGDAAGAVTADAAPEGYVGSAGDCDDGDPTVSPGATETCDGIDDDCDGETDGSVATGPTWYADGDGDGYGDGATAAVACSAPTGFLAWAGDCDDADAGVFPGAAETCDGADDDCDGAVDEADAIDGQGWYADADLDGHGDPTVVVVACDGPAGSVSVADDCDDGAATVFPGATESCDGIDQDCDGEVDEGLRSTWFHDADGDGHGVAAEPTTACDAPVGFVAVDDDCDDGDATVLPGATETCDGVDEDCDGVADDGLTYADWYADLDGDGYGAGSAVSACAAPAGSTATAGDCDDADPTIFPAAVESCDGVDEDCDGDVDEGLATSAWSLDLDADGYGDPTSTVDACAAPASAVTDDTDCDDAQISVHPGAVELCDELDNDCDGRVDPSSSADAQTWYTDADGDGYGTGAAQRDCDPPDGAATHEGDCDDTDASVGPCPDDSAADSATDTTDTAEETGTPGPKDTGGGEPAGCGCAQGDRAASALLLLTLPLFLRRRR